MVTIRYDSQSDFDSGNYQDAYWNGNALQPQRGEQDVSVYLTSEDGGDPGFNRADEVVEVEIIVVDTGNVLDSTTLRTNGNDDTYDFSSMQYDESANANEDLNIRFEATQDNGGRWDVYADINGVDTDEGFISYNGDFSTQRVDAYSGGRTGNNPYERWRWYGPTLTFANAVKPKKLRAWFGSSIPTGASCELQINEVNGGGDFERGYGEAGATYKEVDITSMGQTSQDLNVELTGFQADDPDQYASVEAFEFEYEPVTNTSIWDGSSWSPSIVKYYNGSSWVSTNPKTNDGSSWI